MLTGGGGKICQNLADVICERSLSITRKYCIQDTLSSRAWPGGCSAFRPSARASKGILHTNEDMVLHR